MSELQLQTSGAASGVSKLAAPDKSHFSLRRKPFEPAQFEIHTWECSLVSCGPTDASASKQKILQDLAQYAVLGSRQSCRTLLLQKRRAST
ncbi:hypothetical protein L596_011663 [Steinernema carpocapsae]|uniref:Uncharacterized protein n=1 Tax=Steinernema carpocapsae TaxID=34508 RepID=A0A4U5NUQ4_STECR|nr:hypothetical protein L596_011663 [Steinernema carpocapsae]